MQLSNLSYNDLQKVIDQFKSMDFNISSIADADKLFRLIIKHFVTQTMVWKEPIICRARRHNVDKLLFENTEELIYPQKATTYGRLNEIGESLFYGASHRDTALLEMRPKLGEEFTILESRLIRAENAPKFMEVGIRELMDKQNHSPGFMKQNRVMLERSLGTDDNKRRYKLINDFLVSEMTKVVKADEPHNYKGTIAIGQFYIKGNPLADGIIYPSISRLGAECIAIKPESYHRFYRPGRCFKIKIINVDTNGIPTAFCVDNSVKIDIDGQITWT
jgi:hypothetical protein